ncbi:ABC transporter permease [Halocatena pleomorpha]|uniref:FtsX-like permease family protein n=1 Tax=Halocatena pleomorpha TaxID=1785090 RepID=A0A3P3R7X3_9EURY|nr:ABC transporter permease [Halocatena pleomorpha]RRJ29464.1 FtsX-like permease family protein [Halocatena pleomorpha]
MGYRRTLLTRWSRRDKLAILVIAVTIAFLTGTALVVAAVSTQTTSIAQEYGTDGTAAHYDSVARAHEAAGVNALVVPMATVELPSGETRYVAGISNRQASDFETDSGVSLPPPPSSGVTSGTRRTQGQQRLNGNQQSLTVSVTPRPSSQQLIPSDWYVAHPKTVTKLGASGAYVIHPATSRTGPNEGSVGIPSRGVALRSALAFFVASTRQLLSLLTLTAVGGTTLVGVTIYSVMKMNVRDRRQSIRILRSTGCRPRTVLSLFALRAGLLTLVGIGAGYSLGVILPNVAVNAAVSLGLPTSLSIHVTGAVLTVLGPLYVGTMLVALLAGGAAVWPTVSLPPALITGVFESRQTRKPSTNRLWRVFRLRLLDWRALAPSMATLTVFVTVVLLMASILGVVAPLISAEGTTITEPEAPHPMASNVPQQYADALRSQGVPASAEMIVFAVRNGHPIVVRAANYSAYTTVSNVTIENGRRPQSVDEAVIGSGLARTLGVKTGDRITLGGSTHPGIAMVRVVGTYSASGVEDDQLLVSLPVGRHLLGKTETTVQMIRTARKFQDDTSSSAVEVINLSVPDRVHPNSSVPIRARLRNFGSERTTREVSFTLGNASKSISPTLEPNSQRSVTVWLPTPPSGRGTLRVGEFTKSITVMSPDSIQVSGIPKRAPPNTAPRVSVSTVNGTPVANATIRLSNTTVRTASDGTARLPLTSTGRFTVRTMTRNRTVTQTIHVSRTAQRTMNGGIQIHPENPSILSQTEAHVRLSNPWNQTLTRQIRLAGDTPSQERTVSLPPGKAKTEVFHIGEQSPGSYSIQVISDGNRLSSDSYTVRGDERLIAAYSNDGQSTAGTGIGRAIRSAFGNLQLVFAVFLLLAAVMTIGSTTAVFAQAVQARQQAIGVYRATGVPPIRLLRLIAMDALTIGCIAVGGALFLGTAVIVSLARLDYLVAFGIRISPTLTPSFVFGAVAGGFTIILLSVGLVAGAFLLRSPAELVSNRSVSDNGRTMKEGRGVDD